MGGKNTSEKARMFAAQTVLDDFERKWKLAAAK